MYLDNSCWVAVYHAPVTRKPGNTSVIRSVIPGALFTSRLPVLYWIVRVDQRLRRQPKVEKTRHSKWNKPPHRQTTVCQWTYIGIGREALFTPLLSPPGKQAQPPKNLLKVAGKQPGRPNFGLRQTRSQQAGLQARAETSLTTSIPLFWILAA